MRRRKAWAGLGLWLLCLLAYPSPVGAHAGGLPAFATLDPAAPAPGQPAVLTLEVVDPLGNPVTGGEATVEVAAPGAPGGPAVALAEDRTGFYTGTVTFPAAGRWALRVRMRLPGKEFLGEIPVIAGPGASPIQDVGFELEPAALRRIAWWVWLLAAAAVVLAGEVLYLWLRRRPAAGRG